jgi:hypothetical protein
VSIIQGSDQEPNILLGQEGEKLAKFQDYPKNGHSAPEYQFLGLIL